MFFALSKLKVPREVPSLFSGRNKKHAMGDLFE
jgi:hypothetical protein